MHGERNVLTVGFPAHPVICDLLSGAESVCYFRLDDKTKRGLHNVDYVTRTLFYVLEKGGSKFRKVVYSAKWLK